MRKRQQLPTAVTLAVLMLSVMALTGFGWWNYSLTIRFERVDGLVEGNSVVFEGNVIGTVESVAYTRDGDYLVEAEIKKKFRNSATEDTRFYIDDNPSAEGGKRLVLEQLKPGGKLLENGAAVVGTTRHQVALERLVDTMEGHFDKLRTQWEALADQMRDIPDSEAVTQFEQDLNRMVEEMQRSSREARDRFQKEILPQLKEKLEAWRRQLEKKGREEELAPVERQVEKLESI